MNAVWITASHAPAPALRLRQVTAMHRDADALQLIGGRIAARQAEDVMAGLAQLPDDRGADEPRRSRYEYPHLDPRI
jgi:hypothetical protein